jgi:ribosomal protein S18 acetylase RimI-like enzyme
VVNDPLPLLELFSALDDVLERNDATWWGGVVADSRIPLIYDANYARVESARVSLAEIEETLYPALRHAGARQEHVAVFRPETATSLVDELEAAGGRFTYDTAMRFEGDPSLEPDLEVTEVVDPDARFWQAQRRILPEFDVVDPATIEQFVRWEREILAPAGKRWFSVELDQEPAGFAALAVHDGIGYVDNVVTFQEFRRRGVATALMRRIVREAAAAACDRLYLLADDPGPIGLYERLGFVDVGPVVGWVKAFDDDEAEPGGTFTPGVP